MKPTMSGKSIPARLALLGKVVVAIVLVSCAATATITRLAVAEGATSSSTTTNFVVSTDKPNYTGSDTITVMGVAPSGANAVTVTIYNAARVAIVAVPVALKQDDSFSTVFKAGGGPWDVSGKYTVIAIVQQQDTVAPPPTTNSTFFYTAGPTTSTTPVTTSAGGDGTSSIGSILGVAGVIVVAVALVGFMLRARGRGTKARTQATRAPVGRGS